MLQHQKPPRHQLQSSRSSRPCLPLPRRPGGGPSEQQHRRRDLRRQVDIRLPTSGRQRRAIRTSGERLSGTLERPVVTESAFYATD